MTLMATPGDVHRPYTVADLETMPDDGHRYELIDGELLVSPTPGLPHQEVVYTLYGLLRAACPSDLHVVGAPFAVRLDAFNEYQPDVIVARKGELTMERLAKAPMLAVEVISPTSGLRDANLKKAVYARMGVPSFWLVLPDLDQPALTVFELEAGEYRQVAHVVGDEPFEAQQPFPVRVVPADLVAGLRP